jgi:hypothetical protein
MGCLNISCDCKLSNTFLRVGVHIPSRILSFKPSLKIILQIIDSEIHQFQVVFSKGEFRPFANLPSHYYSYHCLMWMLIDFELRYLSNYVWLPNNIVAIFHPSFELFALKYFAKCIEARSYCWSHPSWNCMWKLDVR